MGGDEVVSQDYDVDGEKMVLCDDDDDDDDTHDVDALLEHSGVLRAEHRWPSHKVAGPISWEASSHDQSDDRLPKLRASHSGLSQRMCQ